MDCDEAIARVRAAVERIDCAARLDLLEAAIDRAQPLRPAPRQAELLPPGRQAPEA